MPEQPTIEHRTEQRYAAIRRPVAEGVPAVVDKAFPELFRWLAGRGLEPSGAAFIRTLAVGDDGEPLEVDAAFPLESDFEPEGAVEAYLLPEGDYVTLRHIGPYNSEDLDDLVDARDALVAYADRRGIDIGARSERGIELHAAVERFHVGPVDTNDFTVWNTEIAYLIGT